MAEKTTGKVTILFPLALYREVVAEAQRQGRCERSDGRARVDEGGRHA